MNSAVGIILLWLAVQKAVAVTHVCDFEDSESPMCDYTQDSGDHFDWGRRQGETPTLATGPFFDHTFGNATGHYAYIEASGPGTWDAARLVSATLDPTLAFCLRFFYHMYGENTGRLSVHLKTDEQMEKESLWTLRGDQGTDWIEAVVEGTSPSPFEIVLQAKRGEGFKSDIAIDDVTIQTDITCSGRVPTTSEPDTTVSEVPPSTEEITPTPTLAPVDMPTVGLVSKQPLSDVTSILLQPIDSRLVIIVLATGLSFWGVVFIALGVVMCRSHQSRQDVKNHVTYHAADVDVASGQELTFVESECAQPSTSEADV